MTVKKSADEPGGRAADHLVVVSAFAYARMPSGEVKQLLKGDFVDPELYVKESIDHLVSIGFVA